MMRVLRISLSMRGRMPGRAEEGQYATPLAAMCSLRLSRVSGQGRAGHWHRA